MRHLLPKPLRGFDEQVLQALPDECLRGAAQFMPDKGERDLIEAFGGDYGRQFDLKKAGPGRDLPSS